MESIRTAATLTLLSAAELLANGPACLHLAVVPYARGPIPFGGWFSVVSMHTAPGGPGVGHMLRKPIPIAAHGPGDVKWTTYNLKLAIERAFLSVAPVEAIIEVTAPHASALPPVIQYFQCVTGWCVLRHCSTNQFVPS